MPEEPVSCLPDICYKAHAEELLDILWEKLTTDIITADAYVYMALGYNSMMKYKYKEATVYFNTALSFPYL